MPKKNNRRQRKLNPVLHIFCEGEKTEPNYLRGYIDKFCPGIRSIRVEPTRKNTPRQLVDEAAKMKRKRESLDSDVFWVVYDRESEQKYEAKVHAAAYQKAKNNDIEIALSNICFEVWILLHFQENIAPFSCYDDLRKRSSLKGHLPDYDKSEKNIFRLLESRVQAARDNAPKLNDNTIKGANPDWNRPDQWNPYTNVNELLDAIDAFAKSIRPS